MLFIALLAFVLASFPARNSDLWIHLAVGRDIAAGSLPPGPTHHTAVGTHSGLNWLYDLASYLIYSVTGGAGLVAGKAAVVVAIALVVFRLCRFGSGWSTATICTALALVAISTRVLLQPVTVSYLFFALTLLILNRRVEFGLEKSRSLLPPWELMLLFGVWANVDSWFIVGLATVALALTGQLLDLPRQAKRIGVGLRMLAALAVLGLICLLNPNHIRAYTLPPELTWVGLGQLSSPFQQSYLLRFARSPAALAYYPLLVFGLLTFILNRSHWQWQRFLPWLGLAVLTMLQVRTVPFFAILTAPLLSWNLHDLFQRGQVKSRQPLGGIRLVGARLAIGILGLALLVCAWPGWLQYPPYEPRNWAIETPPALERCALAVSNWHDEGRLGPHSRALHLSAESLQTFAWHCPQDRGILAAQMAPEGGTPGDWATRMRAEGITHAIVYDEDRERLFEALKQFLADPAQWPMLYLEGELVVFGWRDPDRANEGDAFQGWEVDIDRLAFHPTAEKFAPRQLPDRQPHRWWEALWIPTPVPIDRNEATLHLLHAEALRRSAVERHVLAWEATQLAGLTAAAAAWAGPDALLDVQLRLTLYQPPQLGDEAVSPLAQSVAGAEFMFSRYRDDTHPALLYLAVRAARRALATNPADPQSNLILGESYLRLIQSTRERSWAQKMPELHQLRHAQASAALNRAVELHPSLVQGHHYLGKLYSDLGYIDLAAFHLRASIDANRKSGPPRGVTNEQFRQILTLAEQDLAPVVKAVEEQEKAFAKESEGARVLDRARLALRKGLAGKARDLLLASDVSAFGVEGLALELELLIMTGRYQDVRNWLTTEHASALGEGNYRWYHILAAASAGDYATADDDLAILAGATRDFDLKGPQNVLALAIGKAILYDCPTEPLSIATLGWRANGRIEFSSRVNSLVRYVSQRADVTALRGLLELEVGDAARATENFRLALAYWDETTGEGVDFNGRVISQDCLEWLE